MADYNEQLRAVCADLFAKKMPGNTPTVSDDGPAQRLRVGHPSTLTTFVIERIMAATNGNHTFLDASLFEKGRPGFAECFTVYELPKGQKKFRPAAWWQGLEFKSPSPKRFPDVNDRLIKLLRESVPYASSKKCYWGVVAKGQITEVIAYTIAYANSDESDERPGFYHLMRQGVKSQLSRFTNNGDRFELKDFWELVASKKLVDLEPLLKGRKKRWCQEPSVIVLDDELFAEPKTWEQQPSLKLTDLKGMVKLR